MTQISLPRGSSETGTNEWNDVYSNDNAITTVVNGQLSNDNLDTNAAIAHSKLANGTSGQLLVANSSGVITATSLSGDVSSVGGTGSVTISNDAISSAKLSDATDAEITAGTKTQSNRAVTADHIRDGVITTTKMAATAWTTYTPTWTASTNPAIGNGTITDTGAYVQIGKTVHFRLKITMGSTTTFGSGGFYVGLPVAHNHGVESQIGRVHLLDSSANSRYTAVAYTHSGSSSSLFLSYINAAASQNTLSGITATAPFTWAASDVLSVTGTYEAA